MKRIDAITLILSDARGIYIPRDFVIDECGEIDYEHCKAWHIKTEDAEILKNPDHDAYWDTWNDILNYAYFTDDDGNDYRLHQDGDLWGLCHDRMTLEEKQNFGFED